MTLYEIIHNACDQRMMGWEIACRHAGVTKQGAEYCLRSAKKGPPLPLVMRFAEVLDLDKKELAAVWREEMSRFFFQKISRILMTEGISLEDDER